MNVKEALDLLMGRLGNRTASGLRSKALQELKNAQGKLERAPELPWFIMSESATAFTIPDESRISLPTDFIREVEDENLELLDESGEVWDIIKKGYDEARLQYPDETDPGKPQVYSVRGRYVILRPTPDAEYTIRFPTYYAKQDPPEDNLQSENEWFKNVPDLLIAMAGVALTTFHVKDAELIVAFQAEQKTGEDLLIRDIVAREEANRSRSMG